MNISSQLVIAIMMVATAGSLFWAYRATSVLVPRSRGQDRRVCFNHQTNDRRKQSNDRRNQSEDAALNAMKYWIHRIEWLFVAVTVLIVFALTFGPKI